MEADRLSVNTITLKRIQLQPCASKLDSLSLSSAATKIQTSGSTFKDSCREALRNDFSQN